jgi:hypothetical protein
MWHYEISLSFTIHGASWFLSFEEVTEGRRRGEIISQKPEMLNWVSTSQKLKNIL